MKRYGLTWNEEENAGECLIVRETISSICCFLSAYIFRRPQQQLQTRIIDVQFQHLRYLYVLDLFRLDSCFFISYVFLIFGRISHLRQLLFDPINKSRKSTNQVDVYYDSLKSTCDIRATPATTINLSFINDKSLMAYDTRIREALIASARRQRALRRQFEFEQARSICSERSLCDI